MISFFALAVLWPQPRLEQDDWRPLQRSGGRSASLPVQIALRRDRRLPARGHDPRPGTSAPQTALDNLAPTFLLITFWVGMVFASILFGGVYRAFSPFRALGRAAAVAEPAVPGEARALAGGGRACGSSPGSSSCRGWGENAVDARHRRARLHDPHAGRAVLLGRGDVVAARRGVRGLLRHVRSHVDLGGARRRPRGAAPARRPSAAWTRPPGTVAVRRGDDRHGHVRRPVAGAALEGRARPTSWTRSTGSGSAR